MGGRLVSAFRSGVRLYPGRDPSAGSVPMFFLLFFYYFLEHREHGEPLETLIADFLVELGVIKGIYI